jgi:hypothetical protein
MNKQIYLEAVKTVENPTKYRTSYPALSASSLSTFHPPLHRKNEIALTLYPERRT